MTFVSSGVNVSVDEARRLQIKRGENGPITPSLGDKRGGFMKHDLFSKCIKIVIAGTTLIGIVCCIYLIPELARVFRMWYPEQAYWATPWMIFLYVCAVPCFAAMVVAWMIATNVGKDQSFTKKNSNLFKIFSILALADTGVFGVGSVVFLLLEMNHPGLLLADFLIVFAGLAIFICTAALSYFTGKAASLQEDSDLTI